MSKYILTDGQKAANLLMSDDPAVWTYFGGAAKSDDITLYSKVAAAFRAYNLKANTVGNMPFTLNKLGSGEEFDNSATWENKVKFLPNPSELFRLDTLSYMATNTVYNLRTQDVLGYKTKGLYHAVAMGFNHVTDPVSGAFLYDERLEAGRIERYPDGDKRIVRMWRLDHTTEVLPSPNTEAKAIMNAAGVIYYADSWIKHFFERGGVSPTVIAMKGAVNPTKRDEEEKSWTDWLLGLGGRFRSRIARVFNADTLDVKQFGSSVTELKDNEVYSQALANIAMGVGMPLSLLMANSANYATAKEEKATWYENDIIPLCNWLAYGYNEQVFMPMGLYLEFHPETLDPQQEDETERAQAFSSYMDVVSKCPTFDVFVGMASTLGLELSDELTAALEKYYADKEKQAEETRQQMQGAGVVVGPDGKPVATQKPNEDKLTDKPADTTADDDDEEDEKKPPAKWMPSIDELEELRIWREVAQRKHKKGQPLTFEYQPKAVQLPVEISRNIFLKLSVAKTDDDIKAAFDVRPETVTQVPEYKSEIIMLAEAMNRLAEKEHNG